MINRKGLPKVGKDARAGMVMVISFVIIFNRTTQKIVSSAGGRFEAGVSGHAMPGGCLIRL